MPQGITDPNFEPKPIIVSDPEVFDHILARREKKKIAAIASTQSIVTGTTHQGVVPKPRHHNVIATPRKELISTRATEKPIITRSTLKSIKSTAAAELIIASSTNHHIAILTAHKAITLFSQKLRFRPPDLNQGIEIRRGKEIRLLSIQWPAIGHHCFFWIGTRPGIGIAGIHIAIARFKRVFKAEGVAPFMQAHILALIIIGSD